MKKLFYILFIPLIISGCSKDDPVSPNVSPYKGTWNILFAGSYTGGGDLVVNDEGKFSANVLLISGGQTTTNTISGSIDKSGNVSADIYYAGNKIGTVSGKFNNNSGSGTWITAFTSGTWSASKK